MKTLFVPVLLFSLLKVSAQTPVQFQDTAIRKEKGSIVFPSEKSTRTESANATGMKSLKQKEISELFLLGAKSKNNTMYPSFEGHWSGFLYGFVNFGNTDYSLYDETCNDFMEIDWGHSFSMQFNLFDYSINLVPRNNFGIVTGFGLEYQRLRFEKNGLSVTKSGSQVLPVDLFENPDIATVKRSCFKNLYLTIPLLLELQLPAKAEDRFYISGGIAGGVRMHTKTKVVYKDDDGDKHKKKEKNNFNEVPFKADLIGRIGYKDVCLWGSYTLTRQFKSGKGPQLHAYAIGVGLTF